LDSTLVDGGAEARSAGAPRGWDLGRGAVAPPQYGDLGAMPPEKFSKINVEIAYFSAFLQAKMHTRQSDLYKWRGTLSSAKHRKFLLQCPSTFTLCPP